MTTKPGFMARTASEVSLVESSRAEAGSTPRRPHSKSSPLPTSARSRSRNPRRYSEPDTRVSVSGTRRSGARSTRSIVAQQLAAQRRDAMRHRCGLPAANAEKDIVASRPPYPTTPPLPSTPQTAHVPQPSPSLLTPGFRAPTPLPLQLRNISPTTKEPSRRHQSWKHFLHRLDVALRKLSFIAAFWLLSTIISFCLMIRSLTSGVPHVPAAKTALLIWFCVSATAFAGFFALVLGILCRRARKGGFSLRQQRRVEDEVEMQGSAGIAGVRVGADGRGWDPWARRNAVSGATGMGGASRSTLVGGWPGGHRFSLPASRTGERLIYRPNKLPLRISSAPLPGSAWNREHNVLQESISGQVSYQMSPLVPSTSRNARNRHSWIEMTMPSFRTARRMSHTRSQHTPRGTSISAISPRTQVHPITRRPSETSGLSTQIFDNHMQITGARELEAYLGAPSASNVTIIAPDKRRSIRSSRASLSVYHDDIPQTPDSDDDAERRGHRLRTASVLSMRSAGKARECFVRASPSSAAALSRARENEAGARTREPSGNTRMVATVEEIPGTAHAKSSQGVSRDPPPLAQRADGANRRVVRQDKASAFQEALGLQKPRNLSPMKLGREPRNHTAGLGISVVNGENKENVDPQGRRRRSTESEEMDIWAPVTPSEGA